MIYSLDLLYDSEELMAQWEIERDLAVMDLATTNQQQFDPAELASWREEELDRLERFSVWSKFRVGDRELPGWDGKIYDTR